MGRDRIQQSFLKFYPNSITSGKALSQIGEEMKGEDGYNEKFYAVLSWGSSADINTFLRSVDEHDDLMMLKSDKLLERNVDGFQTMRPVNIITLFQHFTNLPCVRLGYAFQCITGQPLVAHRADNDVLGYTHLVRRLLTGTRHMI